LGRKPRTEFLLGGGAYLLALGGGVLIGASVALVLVAVGTVMWLIAAAGTEWAQRRMPGLGALPLVQDRGFAVIPRDDLARLKAAARRLAGEPADNSTTPTRPTFEEIKPDIESFIEEGRRMYAELDGDPAPDRVGALFDQAREWEERVSDRLAEYHATLATDFTYGGDILTPQMWRMQPTDTETLKVYVGRRGQVLRNVLDGTPGHNL
jgi:hypothetical protein